MSAGIMGAYWAEISHSAKRICFSDSKMNPTENVNTGEGIYRSTLIFRKKSASGGSFIGRKSVKEELNHVRGLYQRDVNMSL